MSRVCEVLEEDLI